MTVEFLQDALEEIAEIAPWMFSENFRRRLLKEPPIQAALPKPPREPADMWVVDDRVADGFIQVYAKRGANEMTFGDPISIKSPDKRTRLIEGYAEAEATLEDLYPGKVKPKRYL